MIQDIGDVILGIIVIALTIWVIVGFLYSVMIRRVLRNVDQLMRERENND